jgi:hypothetical protein
MTTQAISPVTTDTTAGTSGDADTRINRYERFGYAMKGLCSVIVLGERGVLAIVDEAVHDSGRRATAHELVKAIDAAMYEVAAALTTWAQQQIDALRGNPDAVPDLPPFTPPPYPQDTTSLAATLLAIVNLAQALAGEASTVLPATPSSKQLIGALATAIDNIQNDWQSVFGLQAS